MAESATSDGAGRANAPGGPGDVLITGEPSRRPARSSDHTAEAHALARTLATGPRGLVQHVAETAMAPCRGDSAVVGVLEPGGEHGILRWRAATGALAANVGGAMPREGHACGELGDTFELESSPDGGGTTLHVGVPLERSVGDGLPSSEAPRGDSMNGSNDGATR